MQYSANELIKKPAKREKQMEEEAFLMFYEEMLC